MAVKQRASVFAAAGVFILIDDDGDGRKRMSRDNFIDLYDFPETAAAAAPGAPAAAHRQPARDVINLLDADDASSDEPQPYSPSHHRRKEKKRYKTDPDELPAPSKKKRRQTLSVDPPAAAAAPPGPELQILEIFPDADVATLKTLLNQFQNNVPMVLSHMADHPYQKSEQKPAAGRDSLVHRMPSDDNPWKYDYTSTESFAITSDYSRQATDQLLADFAFLSQHGAKNILQKHKFHYAVAHEKILTAIKGTTGSGGEDAQYDRVLSALECAKSRSTRLLQPDQMERLQSCCTSHFRKAPTLKNFRKGGYKALVSNEILLEEIRFVKTKLREWMDAQRQRRERQAAQQRAQQQGTALECGCCFDSYPIEAMVSCRDEGHLFCTDCLKLYAEQQVFGQGNLGIDKKTKQPALELLCCYGGGDGCSSGFHRGCLEKALKPKTLQKYDEVQFQISIERAGLSCNVCSCSKCGFQADVPETQRVFQCPVAECGYASCRDCGEAAHIPLRCEEVEKEVQTKGRLTVEEAISQAVIRKCPKCRKAIIKSDGCNKIRCACGTFMCYLCQKSIRDYSHFCQTPHCTHGSCGICPLYTKAEEDDARAMRQAAYAAAEEVRKQQNVNSNPQDNSNKKKAAEVRVDVEGILNAK